MTQTVLNVGSFNRTDLIQYLQDVSNTEGPDTKVLVKGNEIPISQLLQDLQFAPESTDLAELLGTTITIEPGQVEKTIDNFVSAGAKLGVDIDDMLEQMEQLNFLLSKAQKAERNTQRDIQTQQDAAKVAEMRQAAADRFVGSELQSGLQIAGGVLGLCGAAASARQLTKLKGSDAEMDSLLKKLDDPAESKKLTVYEKEIGYAEKNLRMIKEQDVEVNAKVGDAQKKVDDLQTKADAADKKVEDARKDAKEALKKNVPAAKAASKTLEDAEADAAAIQQQLGAAKDELAKQKKELLDLEMQEVAAKLKVNDAFSNVAQMKSQTYTQFGQALQGIMTAVGSAGNAASDFKAAEHDAKSQEAQSASDRAKSKAEDFEDARREFRDAAKDLISSMKEKLQMENDTSLNIIRHV